LNFGPYAVKLSRDILRQAMAAMSSKGGKRSLETMTPEERSARARQASLAAAKKRTAERLGRERKAKRK
jgi:beta-lactamase class D